MSPVWELVTNVPILPNKWAYACFILNLLLPGTGTITAAFYNDFDKTQFVIGILQLCTSVYLIGWAWSIFWGYLIVVKSRGGHREMKTLLGANDMRSDERSTHLRP